MLLIDTLVASTQGNGRVTTTLPKSCIAAGTAGVISPLIHIELMAQAFAAAKGWEIIETGGEFPIGYLVGVQQFSTLSEAKAGDLLTIEVGTVGEFEGFAIVEGSVKRGDTLIAAGKIKLWVPQDEEK